MVVVGGRLPDPHPHHVVSRARGAIRSRPTFFKARDPILPQWASA